MKLPSFMKHLAVCTFFCISSFVSQSATYYVDPSSTASTANGSLTAPWKTLAQVNSSMSLFQPGDQILFKRGQKFSGNLTISRSGTAGNPIVFGAYGTGADPHFWGTGATLSSLFYLYNRSYITFQNLNISDTTISETDRSIQSKIQRAFYIDGTSSYVVIKKCRLDRVGIGAYMVGDNNTIDSCDIGNMRMVRNTPTTVNPDDDYGANPVVISSSGNSITYNYFHDCWANSYDYMYDGGAIEFYGDGASNNFIGYNTFIDCNGVVEHGSGNGGNITGNMFVYNKMINNGSLFYINNGGTFTVTVSNLQFLNNVIVENVVNRLNQSSLGGMRTTSTAAGIVVMKNNVVWLTSGIDLMRSSQWNAGQLVHEDNIYKLGTGSLLNFTASGTELTTTSNTIFTNSSSSDPLAWNYTPAAGSPAIDFGQGVGLSRDFLGNPVSGTNPPDAGIIESVFAGALQATAVAGTISCNGGTTVVAVNASGGVSPYTGTGNFTLGAGTHPFTVTDANGATATTSVTIAQPSAISGSLTSGTITIQGGSTNITVTASGGTGTKTYRLNGGAYQSANQFNNVTAGSHTVTIKDGNGCTLNRTITITEPAALQASAVSGNITCAGGTTTITVNASGGVTPYTGTGSYTVSAGTYSYTVTDVHGATSTANITVSEPAPLTGSLTAGTITMFGGTTQITASASGGTGTKTYKLNNGNYQSSATFSGVSAGSHTVTMKDANGCTITRSLTISEPSQLAGTAQASAISCYGGMSTVTVSATGGISPYTGTGTFSVPAGTQQFTITDAGGASTVVNLQITQPTQLSLNLTAGTISIFGGQTNINAVGSGGAGGYTYKLNGGNYQASGSFSGVSAGNHTVTVKDANGCEKSETIQISQPAALAIQVQAGNMSCHNGSATITVTATGGAAPYSGTGTFTVSAGTYNYTVTDAQGTSVSQSVNVTEPAAIEIAVATGTITVTGGTTSVQVSATGGTGAAYTYKLNSGEYQASNQFNNVAAGNHSVTVKDANGCTSVKTFTIDQPAPNPLLVSASSTSISCHGGLSTVTISATGGLPPYAGVGSFNVAAGAHQFTVTDANGTSTTTSIQITEPEALNLTVQVMPFGIRETTTTVQIVPTGGTGTFRYSLNSLPYQDNSSFAGVAPGDHIAYVQDQSGCTAQNSFTVNMPSQPGLQINLVNKNNATCRGGNDGLIEVLALGGAAPYTYSINNGRFGTQPIFGNLRAGNYTITVKDAQNASNSITVSVLDGRRRCNGLVTTGRIILNAYPNPTIDRFSLRIDSEDEGDVQIQVMNAEGKPVHQATGPVEKQYIFGEKFKPGTYFIRVIQGKSIETLKVIKGR